MAEVFRVFQIEDNVGDAAALRYVFRRLDPEIELTTVSSAERALVLLSEAAPFHYSLLLVDINLPQMNGLEFLKRLKKTAITTGAPVFILSSSQLDSDVAQAYSAGADGYLIKPSDSVGYKDLAKYLYGIWTGDGPTTFANLRVPPPR